MIEKLKSAISHKNNSLELEQSNISSRKSGGGQHSSITARDIQKIFPQENNPKLNQAWILLSTFDKNCPRGSSYFDEI